MKEASIRTRDGLIKQLQQMNFNGPVRIGGNYFMLYHGKAIAIPDEAEYSVARIRYLLRQIERFVSAEDWQR